MMFSHEWVIEIIVVWPFVFHLLKFFIFILGGYKQSSNIKHVCLYILSSE